MNGAGWVKVRLWNADTMQPEMSRREYRELRVTELVSDHMGTYSGWVTVYADQQTGIVTADVAAFERWIA